MGGSAGDATADVSVLPDPDYPSVCDPEDYERSETRLSRITNDLRGETGSTS